MWRPDRRILWRTGIALAAALFVAPAIAATINGTVFEDVNYGGGAGRPLSTPGVQGAQGVRVELYRPNGSYRTSTTTNNAGAFTLAVNTNVYGTGQYYVRVVTGTAGSRRSGCTMNPRVCVAVQTFRTDASSGVAVDVADRVGGENPSISDAPRRSGGEDFADLTISGVHTPQSFTRVLLSTNGADVDGVDFGLNFNTIVNTRDAASCNPSGNGNSYFPCQGSLRQFIINSNALAGEGSLAQVGSGQLDGLTTVLPTGFESSIFMIPTSGIAVITLAGALPTMTGANTRLDATTQTVNMGDANGGSLGAGGAVGVDGISLPAVPRPEVQLNAAASATPVTLNASNQAILGFALRQGYILLSGANGLARNNLVGMTATGSSADNSAAAYGIAFSAPNATIRNNYVTVNNSAIRSDGGGANSVITLNEVGRRPRGTRIPSTAFC